MIFRPLLYSSGDWLLKFLYRTASVQIKIAGLAPIDWSDRQMINLDLTHVVSLANVKKKWLWPL